MNDQSVTVNIAVVEGHDGLLHNLNQEDPHWNKLVSGVQKKKAALGGSLDLVLLNEMPFCKWAFHQPTYDEALMEELQANHLHSLPRLKELGTPNQITMCCSIQSE